MRVSQTAPRDNIPIDIFRLEQCMNTNHLKVNKKKHKITHSDFKYENGA